MITEIDKDFNELEQKTNNGNYDDFLEKLASVESGKMSYKTKSKFGYLGKYQMGEYALVDVGFYYESNKDYKAALNTVSKGQTDIIINIPSDFEKNLIKENKSTVFISADAVNGIKAGLGVAYAGAILQDFNREIREEWIHLPKFNEIPQIEIRSSQWYNPHKIGRAHV